MNTFKGNKAKLEQMSCFKIYRVHHRTQLLEVMLDSLIDGVRQVRGKANMHTAGLKRRQINIFFIYVSKTSVT